MVLRVGPDCREVSISQSREINKEHRVDMRLRAYMYTVVFSHR